MSFPSSYTPRDNCRACGNEKLAKVIDLGNQFIQSDFLKSDILPDSATRFPTKLVRCTNPVCGLVQLSGTVDRDLLYSTYWYRSGTNNTMKRHLKGIVNESLQRVNKKRPIVLDIGCNDGTMLRYYPDHCIKYGIDPSDIARSIKEKATIFHDFFPTKHPMRQVFDIVTTIAMFYDIDDPVNFSKAVKKILSNKGIWIIEVAYLPLMLRNGSYDTICHEHLSYFSLTALSFIMKKSGLKIVKAEQNKINGGSIRCFITHADSHYYDDLKSSFPRLMAQEAQQLFSENTYSEFARTVSENKKQLVSLLKDLVRQQKRIHVYGASTKGNTILQYSQIDHRLIEYCSDKNPEKWGTRTPGTRIPIISEAESRKMAPDYYLVLPWSFRSEFLKREKRLLDRGVRMIFPLPVVEIVGD